MAPKRKVEGSASAKQPSSPRKTRSSSTAVKLPEVHPPAKKPKKSLGEKAQNEPQKSVKTVAVEGNSAKTIVVEACKQCHQFKKRSTMVKDGLEKAIPDINVLVNPEKPRRGCFEIRDANGKTFVSLLNMPRPFTRMRELDMDALISEIIDKVK